MSDPNRQQAAVNCIIESRTRRRKHFSAWLFADPAWDILLAVYAATLDDKMVSITSLAAAAKVSRSTVERWLTALEREGLICRHLHIADERVSLSARGRLAMDQYIDEMSLDLHVAGQS